MVFYFHVIDVYEEISGKKRERVVLEVENLFFLQFAKKIRREASLGDVVFFSYPEVGYLD